MDIERLYLRLSDFADILETLTRSLDLADARWKPVDGAWSILEIVRHLTDEETDDFRVRIEMTLLDPTEKWPPIAPQKAAIDRQYNEGDLEEAVRRFRNEREKSLAWLQPKLDLIKKKSDQFYPHPDFGNISVGELFVSWVGHDQLHIRQIAKRRMELTQRDGANYSTRYAGNW